MKKKLLIGAIVLAVAALTTSVVLAALVEDPEDPGSFYMVVDPPSGGTCICPMVFAPVVCDKGDETKAYSNACFAACDGATNCREVVWQP